jgi:nitroreductase
MPLIENIIKNRRSIYPDSYLDTPIKKETLDWILEMANWAPNHKKTEPWRFQVFHSESARKLLGAFLANAFKNKALQKGGDFPELKYNKTLQKPLKSGAVIAICMQRDPKESIPEWEEIAAVSCAVQNMWLAASSIKLGAYWSTPSAIIQPNDFLKLQNGERCLGLFYIGHKKDIEFNSTRKHILDKVKYL